MSPLRTATLCLVALLVACSSPAPQSSSTAATASLEPLADAYAARLQSGEVVYRVDAATSQVLIYAFRGGRAVRLGHNHTLTAPHVDAYVSLPSQAAADAYFDVRVRLDSLVIDDPALREKTGGAFVGERSESDIVGTQRNMLGTRGFNAELHPEVRLRAMRIEGDWPMLVVRIAIEMHGVTRERELLMQVEHDAERLRARGEFVLRQSEFGVTPLSILGGVIAVQDPFAIRFDLVALRM